MSELTDKVSGLVMPKLQELGLRLWDIEFKKEGADYYLRVYIDSDEGIGIEQCQAVTEYLDPILDIEDPIDQPYILEISSAGLVRELRKESHYAAFRDKQVLVRTYKSLNGMPKSFPALLRDFDNESFIFEINGENLRISRSDVAKISVDLV